jgi:hypothetical protein
VVTHMNVVTHECSDEFFDTSMHTHVQCIFVLCKTLNMDAILGVQAEDLKPNMQARIKAAWCDCDGIEVCPHPRTFHFPP